VPPVNDTDVYAHDIGLIAIEDGENGGLAGFNVLIGGGMGMTHGSKKTYARLGQSLGFCTPAEVAKVAEAVMLVQRDNGDRTNRKHAR
jgi:sulfite reductase (NADPH) hemoprotein beta-component